MPPQRRPLEERFWEKVVKTDSCWQWIGTMNLGYGQIGAGGKYGRSLWAHRVAYEMLVGPIPEGLQIDHLCRNRACVNPAHMEPVTSAVNVLRGESPPAHNARATHCRAGHPLSGDNLYISPVGRRGCFTCRRAQSARHNAKRRAA